MVKTQKGLHAITYFEPFIVANHRNRWLHFEFKQIDFCTVHFVLNMLGRRPKTKSNAIVLILFKKTLPLVLIYFQASTSIRGDYAFLQEMLKIATQILLFLVLIFFSFQFLLYCRLSFVFRQFSYWLRYGLLKSDMVDYKNIYF